MLSGNFLVLLGFRWLGYIHSFWNHLCHTHHWLTAHSCNLFHPFNFFWFLLLNWLRRLFSLLDWLGFWLSWFLWKENSWTLFILFLGNWAKKWSLWLLRWLGLWFWDFLLDRLRFNLFFYRLWFWFKDWIVIFIVSKKRRFLFLLFTFLFHWLFSFWFESKVLFLFIVIEEGIFLLSLWLC